MSKVTKRNQFDGYDQDFWLVGYVVHTEWDDAPDGTPRSGPADDIDAINCGTTLSALHQELTEGGEGCEHTK